MSALWVLALGASIGYLTFKQQQVMGRLEVAVQEYEGAGAKPSDPEPPHGANFKEIKEAWRYTADTRNRDFNERLPNVERQGLLAAEDRQAAEVQKWDRETVANPPANIEGVYLDYSVGA